ncbi:hypothetical protein ARMGADRAFT_1056524 [Armillaria gallica]|uniref:C2H2-type domain-containing protein n=1 Tax=Armillaria gallica TaxID=47427 RepID=A0A2H3EV23_ARMGA|nr:hypothetical protein ARMGADRAFT_1056524 [Armillaria gallica]
MAGMTEDISCAIFIEDAGGSHQLDNKDVRNQHDSSSSYAGTTAPFPPSHRYNRDPSVPVHGDIGYVSSSFIGSPDVAPSIYLDSANPSEFWSRFDKLIPSVSTSDDETPGSNSRSLSLASMPNLDDLDHDFLSVMRFPSVAPTTHSDSGIDSSVIFHFDINPSVGTSDIFGDIAEQKTSRLVTDASLSPTSYREQVASDAVARASQSRRTAANYTCNECHQTFTAKHNLNNHLNSHYGVRNFRCEVPNCNKSFGTSHVRRYHMLKCHSESA